jgi:hypothetical protein
MLTYRKLLLLVALALLNAALFVAKPTPASATVTDPEYGLCSFCGRPSGATDWCCVVCSGCGGDGPKCCQDASVCS